MTLILAGLLIIALSALAAWLTHTKRGSRTAVGRLLGSWYWRGSWRWLLSCLVIGAIIPATGPLLGLHLMLVGLNGVN